MFGIGLPELIVILGVALIVVGPEKLPELAKSLAKGVAELKKTANALKGNLNEELNDKPWEQPPAQTYPQQPQAMIPPSEDKGDDVVPGAQTTELPAGFQAAGIKKTETVEPSEK